MEKIKRGGEIEKTGHLKVFYRWHFLEVDLQPVGKARVESIFFAEDVRMEIKTKQQDCVKAGQ